VAVEDVVVLVGDVGPDGSGIRREPDPNYDRAAGPLALNEERRIEAPGLRPERELGRFFSPTPAPMAALTM